MKPQTTIKLTHKCAHTDISKIYSASNYCLAQVWKSEFDIRFNCKKNRSKNHFGIFINL